MSVRGRGVCVSREGTHVPEKVVMSCYAVNILRWDVNTCPCVCTLLLTSALPYLALFPVLLLPLLSCFASVLQFSMSALLLHSLCSAVPHVVLCSELFCHISCFWCYMFPLPPTHTLTHSHPHTHTHTLTHTHTHTYTHTHPPTHTLSLCV